MGNATAQAISRGVVQVYTPEHLAAVVNERRFEARYQQLTDLPVIIVSDKDIKEEERKITKADLNNNYGITDVDLSFNQITKLQDLQQLVKAKRLDISYNKIEHLNYISQLKELEVLKASDNTTLAGRLSPAVGSLLHLTDLDLSFNKVIQLPDNIGQLVNLKRLNLRMCISPEPLPASFTKLEKLEYLNLYGAQLEALPNGFDNLKNLKWLCLRANRLHQLADLPLSLEYLDLTGNSLSAAEVTRVRKCTNLAQLRLSNMIMREFPEWLTELPKLAILDLGHNQLQQIPAEIIAKMQTLEKISLFHNLLDDLPRELWELPKLRVVTLRSNGVAVNTDRAVLRHSPRNIIHYFKTGALDDSLDACQSVKSESDTYLVGQQLVEEFMNRKVDKSSVREGLFPISESTLSLERIVDIILGVLIGNAVGDAVGLSTEFLDKELAHFYYDAPIRFDNFLIDSHRSGWVPGDWTDDTDQMILIMDTLLELKGDLDPVNFGKKLSHWLSFGFPELSDEGGSGCGRTTYNVLSAPDFKTDPHKAAKDVWEKANKNAAANGAVMRTSILGIPNFDSLEKVTANTETITKVTHYDPRCLASSAAVTHAIALLLQGKYDPSNDEDISTLVKRVYKLNRHYLEDKEQRREFERCLRENSLFDLYLDENGKIGYTYKTLGAGFWALRESRDFESGVNHVTFEAGDADTNCAVVGALLGAKFGVRGIPDHLLQALPHWAWLKQRICRFFDLLGIGAQE